MSKSLSPEEKERKRLYQKEYYKKNKTTLNQQKKLYRKNNKGKIKEYNKKWMDDNKEKRKNYKQNFYQDNKERIQIYDNEYRRHKIKTDPKFRLKENIRKSILKSFNKNGYTKSSKTHDILGCTFEEFKEHIEVQFEDWMTWDNYGNPNDGILELNKTWDLDHIVPLSTALNENDIVRLNHYTNLQPLCSYVNRKIKRDN